MSSPILSILMNQIMGDQDTQRRVNDENRQRLSATAEEFAKNRDLDALSSILPQLSESGVDPRPFAQLAGRAPSQAEQIENQFNSLIMNALTEAMNGGQGTRQGGNQGARPNVQPAASSSSTTTPTALNESAVALAAPNEPTAPAQAPPEIFSQNMLLRMAVKKFTNIDVGAHYFEAPQWFQSYGQRTQSGIPVEQAISDTAVEFGFIPDGASNLEGLSKEDRTVLFEREFSAAFADKTLDTVLRQQLNIPPGTDISKYKAGVILEAFAANSRYIAEPYQKFLDRHRNLDDPEFIDDNLKTWIYQTTGKNVSEITPDDVANARTSMNNDAIIQAARNAAATTSARTQVEFDMEASKPVSAEDRAKFGVPSRFETVQELVDNGYRFPSADEQELYGELHSIRAQMEDFRESLFGNEKDPSTGIFTGIGNSLGKRGAAKATLLKERVSGTPRGQNYQYYEDVLAALGRTLLKMANSGSAERPTDVDIQQIMQSAPDPGGGLTGVPDSEEVARRKYERYMMLVGQQLARLKGTTTLGLSGKAPAAPTAPAAAPTTDADAAAQALIDKYSKGGK